MTRSLQDSVAARAHGLTRGAVVTAALDLVHRDGPQAVTMRAIASRLGVRAQSLYTHIDSRNDLFDALADYIVCDMDDDPDMRHVSSDPWQRCLADTARAVRRYAHRYPNAFVLLATRPVYAARPQPPFLSQRWIDTMLASLTTSGFTGEQAAFACRIFDAFLLGSLLLETRDCKRATVEDRHSDATTPRFVRGPAHQYDDDFASALDNVIHRVTACACAK